MARIICSDQYRGQALCVIGHVTPSFRRVGPWDGEGEREYAALAQLALHPDASAVMLHNLHADRLTGADRQSEEQVDALDDPATLRVSRTASLGSSAISDLFLHH